MTYQDDALPPPTEPSPERTARIARIGSRVRRGTPFVGGVVAAFLAIALWTALFPGPRPLTTTDVKQNIASALASVTPAPPRSQLVYAAVQPSLVLIEADSLDAAGKPRHGLGTGVVVDLAGDILTALHVVDKSTAIKLTFADGSTSGANILARQPDHDIAVLQPTEPPANIVPATLGNPNAVQIGTEAFIVGNPFGLYGSLSSGVVSGLGRTFQLPSTGLTIHGLIQVDAAVNPGNSGGPLLNRDGQVVGIVTGLVNPTKEDVFIGIGLAVPIDVAGGAAGLPQY
jgi:S1-C subfamily serine protease